MKNLQQRGIIYCRVSDPSQVQGTSLDGQKEECIRYAEKSGIKVARVFIEKGESATAANRTEFIKALDFCRTHKNQVNAFIVWKIDRFARNTTDHYAVRAKLSQYGTTLYSVTEFIDDTPMGKMMENMLAGYAQFENDLRRQRCEGGMQRKIVEGIWPWQPPIGYTHSKTRKDRRKTRPDEPDAERFYLIQKGLKAASRGEHTITSLTATFNSWGLRSRTEKPMFKQLVDKILRNKYYAGVLMNPWTGEEHAGLHMPMISLEEYNQIQFFKSGLSNNATRPRALANPDFPLRSLLLCACGKKITASWQTGRKGVRHPYYRCYNPECEYQNRNTPRDDLESKFYELLSEVRPTDEFCIYFKETVIDVWQNQQSTSRLKKDGYEQRLKKLTDQKSRLVEMRMNGEIVSEDFLKMRDALDIQVTAMKVSKHDGKIEELDLEKAINKTLELLKGIDETWRLMKDVKRKQRLQRLVLPEGITYHRNTQSFGTAVLSPVFSLSRDFSGDKSPFVGGGGFEPPIFWLCFLLQLSLLFSDL